MAIKKIIISSLIALILFLRQVSHIEAVITPSFPSCLNPQGTTKVSYSSGSHGIVGTTAEYTGSDTVYTLSSETQVQCFCSEQGDGIQTNWWKINSLSQEEIDQFVKLGWTYIPSGANWGLDESSYLAINQNYSCGGGGDGGNPTTPASPPVCDSAKPVTPQLISVVRQGTKAVVTWTKVDLATHYTLAYGTKIGDYPYGVPNTGNVTTYTVGALDPGTTYYFRVYAVNSCMPSDASGTAPQGSAVLGLATTGDSVLLYSVFAAALLLSATVLVLRKRG